MNDESERFVWVKVEKIKWKLYCNDEKYSQLGRNLLLLFYFCFGDFKNEIKYVKKVCCYSQQIEWRNVTIDKYNYINCSNINVE